MGGGESAKSCEDALSTGLVVTDKLCLLFY